MRRGTNPVLTFELPEAITISALYITFQQNRQTVLEKDLDEVIVLCDTLNQYINLSYKRKYISGDQCHYWAELVRPVRQKAFNWKRNDSNRAAALREAKANQELAKMGQMAQQIAEALARNP